MACPKAAAACRRVVVNLFSLKVLLSAAFIILMSIAGFLGFFLTYLQSQQSLRDSADVDMKEATQSVANLLISKVQIGHQLNYAESMYFFYAGLRLDDFASAYS
eukprot:RCo047269